MTRMLVGRVLTLIPTMLLASFGVFLLVQLAPGDPAIAMAGEGATTAQIEAIREQQGFDQPILVQYWHWLTNALHGDLGTSITSGTSVVSEISRTLPPTLAMVIGAMVVAITLGVSAGVVSARRANQPVDTVITSASAAGAAMPSFWLGLVLVSVFALNLGWFPATGFVGFTTDPWLAVQHLVLPAIALGVAGAAEIARQLRAVLIETLASDHVRTLRAKGLAERQVVWRHALKGAAVPLMTVIGLQVSRFLGATVVVEAVFGIAGVGTLVVGAAQNKDYPVVEGVVLVMAFMVILTNFVVDASYRIFDPRIR